MRKFTKISISVLLILSFIMLMPGCSSSTGEEGNGEPEAKTYNFKVAHFFGASHEMHTVAVEGWMEAIETATDGQVTFTAYPGETLLKATETYDGLESGVTDLGLAPFGYSRGRFPVCELFDLAGIDYANGEVASKVAMDVINEYQPKELDNMKMFMVISTGPGHLYTKKPVKTLEDLQALKIRVTGLSTKTMETMGVTPVALSMSETYEALQRGLADGCLADGNVLEGWNMADVVDYITYCPFLYTSGFYFGMNMDVWNSLPADLQATIQEASDKFFEETGAGVLKEINDRGIQYGLDQGMEAIELSAEEEARWREFLEPLHQDYIDMVDAEGYPGEEILEYAKSQTAKYNKEY